MKASAAHLWLVQTMDMDQTRSAIGGTMDRFRKAMENKGNRSLAYVVLGVVVLFVIVRIVS